MLRRTHRPEGPGTLHRGPRGLVRTADGVFDVWVHPAVTGFELSTTRDALLDAVELWRTAPMVPTEEISLNF